DARRRRQTARRTPPDEVGRPALPDRLGVLPDHARPRAVARPVEQVVRVADARQARAGPGHQRAPPDRVRHVREVPRLASLQGHRQRGRGLRPRPGQPDPLRHRLRRRHRLPVLPVRHERPAVVLPNCARHAAGRRAGQPVRPHGVPLRAGHDLHLPGQVRDRLRRAARGLPLDLQRRRHAAVPGRGADGRLQLLRPGDRARRRGERRARRRARPIV
ncbi:MAG: hypothetical protein AVDCRST_MAG64-3374, partial [uncultured Phycisphaerae bacterium]